MTKEAKLTIIKIIHSVVWIFFNVVIFYLYYAAIANKIGKWVWICIALILVEALILLIFKKLCPITLIARRYSDSTKDNFDIYLPNWLAKHNKSIYTTLFIIVVAILIFRLLFQ